MSIVLEDLRPALRALGLPSSLNVPRRNASRWCMSTNDIFAGWEFCFQNDGEKITCQARDSQKRTLKLVRQAEKPVWHIEAPAGSDIHCWIDEIRPRNYWVAQAAVKKFCDQYRDDDVPADTESMIALLWFTALND